MNTWPALITTLCQRREHENGCDGSDEGGTGLRQDTDGFVITGRHTPATPPDGPMDVEAHTTTTSMHTNFHDARNSAYICIGALDATSLGSFQQADPGGLHQPHWSFSVLSHCPHLLLLQLHLTALLWAPLHQCCSYCRCSGCRYTRTPWLHAQLILFTPWLQTLLSFISG